jgi:hypothetical protein
MKWISVNDRLPNDLENVLVIEKHTTDKDYIYIAFFNGTKWVAYAPDVLEVQAGWNGGTIESNIEEGDIEFWQHLPSLP